MGRAAAGGGHISTVGAHRHEVARRSNGSSPMIVVKVHGSGLEAVLGKGFGGRARRGRTWSLMEVELMRV